MKLMPKKLSRAPTIKLPKEDLYEQIEEIERKTENGKSGIGFFEKIKALIEHLFSSSQSAPSSQSQSVNN